MEKNQICRSCMTTARAKERLWGVRPNWTTSAFGWIGREYYCFKRSKKKSAHSIDAILFLNIQIFRSILIESTVYIT